VTVLKKTSPGAAVENFNDAHGLIDILNQDEVLDLIAYIRSAGDPKDKAFNRSGLYLFRVKEN